MRGADEVAASERQRIILTKWVRGKAESPYRLVERSRVVLLSADGVANAEQALRLGVDRQRVRRWRARWSAAKERLTAAEQEGANDRDLARLMRSVLTDEQRPGAPSTFSAEQLTRIIAVACEPPEDSGRPVTQALERLHPTLPTRPGKSERIEFEYIRHGTLCLIANFDVATGQAILPTISTSRTEQDFAAHIEPAASAVHILAIEGRAPQTEAEEVRSLLGRAMQMLARLLQPR